MRNKLLLLLALVLLGCDPLARLCGDHPKEAVPAQRSQLPTYLEGRLQGSNFVEVDTTGAKEIVIYLKHKKKWKELEPYDPAHKTSAACYLVTPTMIIFVHTTPNDFYSIKISH